jgi:ornithine carbamoyltransferase
VARSPAARSRGWVQAAVRFGFSLRMAAPVSCQVPDSVLSWARAEGGHVTVTQDPREAVQDADAVVTDCFVSMSDDPGRNSHAALLPYRVTTSLMEQAAPDALFMHCLPAHRGEEVDSAVIDGRWSVVFDEAENRLHAQAGILAWLMDPAR